MHHSKYFIWKVLGLLVLLVMIQVDVDAQCAMCSLTAENATQNGNVQGKGLNNGILFLLAMPYLAVAGLGILWYTRFRKKKQQKMHSSSLTS